MSNIGQVLTAIVSAAPDLVSLEIEIERALADLKASPKHPSDYMRFAAAQLLAAAPTADKLAPIFEPASAAPTP
jgi:hypothetical protein